MITGQVGLIESDGRTKGELVAWATRSRYSHMVVAVSETLCVSAEPGGARIRPIEFYPEVVWSRYSLRPSQRRRIVRYALSKLGTKYAWLDYFAAGIASVTRTNTPEWLRSFIETDDRLICSQLCDLALQAAGIHVFFDERPAGAVVPASFGRVFVARGWASKP